MFPGRAGAQTGGDGDETGAPCGVMTPWSADAVGCGSVCGVHADARCEVVWVLVRVGCACLLLERRGAREADASDEKLRSDRRPFVC